MIVPTLLAWVVERREVVRFRIIPANVVAFIAVAFVASETQIVAVVASIVLDGTDVIDVKRQRPAAFRQQSPARARTKASWAAVILIPMNA